MKQWIVILLALSACVAQAREVFKGEPALAEYTRLKQLPTGQTGSVRNLYFGDAERPQLGRLAITTIYPIPNEQKLFCYESDFYQVGVKEYVCERD